MGAIASTADAPKIAPVFHELFDVIACALTQQRLIATETRLSTPNGERTYPIEEYAHPHESKHSIAEVLRWFDMAGVEFLSGIPAPDASAFTPDLRLFTPHPRGTGLDHLGAELRLLIDGRREGGLFMMIGRRAHGDTL